MKEELTMLPKMRLHKSARFYSFLRMVLFVCLSFNGCIKKKAIESSKALTSSEGEYYFAENDCPSGIKIAEIDEAMIYFSVEKKTAGDHHLIYSIKPTFSDLEKTDSAKLALSNFLKSQGSQRISFDEKGIESYRKCYGKILEFVFEHYRERRHWSNSFIEELKTIAKNYELFSEYIVVTEKKDSKLIGTLRFISAPYGRLYYKHGGTIDNSTVTLAASFVFPWTPFSEIQSLKGTTAQLKEKLSTSFQTQNWKEDGQNNWTSKSTPRLPLEEIGFQILRNASGHCEQERDLKFTAINDKSFKSLQFPEQTEVCFAVGELIEPGNLAVNKTANDEVRPILVLEMARKILSHNTDLQAIVRNRNLVTYNDKHRLYTLMGMTLTGQSIEKYGTTWKLLDANPSHFFSHFGVPMALNQNMNEEKMLQRMQATVKNIDWKFLDGLLEMTESEDSKGAQSEFTAAHSAYFSNLKSAAIESEDKSLPGYAEEKCGFIRQIKANAADNRQESRFTLETLFAKEQFVLIPQDGSSFSTLLLASENSRIENLTPYCVFADFETPDEVFVGSAGWLRPW